MLDCQRALFSLPPDLHYLNGAYMSPQLRTVKAAGLAGLEQKDDPTRITRASVAHRLVELLNDRSHDGSAVVITN